MEKLFIPYKLSQELLSIGFDRDCIAIVYPDDEIVVGNADYIRIMLRKAPEAIKSPLWQQAFDWFISNGYWSNIEWDDELNVYDFKWAYMTCGFAFQETGCDTILQARTACLEFLLKQYKKQKQLI